MNQEVLNYSFNIEDKILEINQQNNNLSCNKYNNKILENDIPIDNLI